MVNMRHRSFQFVDGSHLLCQLCEESVSLLKKFITAHLVSCLISLLYTHVHGDPDLLPPFIVQDSLENDVIIEFCNRLPKLPSEHVSMTSDPIVILCSHDCNIALR